MEKAEVISRFDVAFVQWIERRPKGREPQRPDIGKIARAVVIKEIARSLLANDVDVCGVENCSRYSLENKRRFYRVYESCPRNIERLQRRSDISIIRRPCELYKTRARGKNGASGAERPHLITKSRGIEFVFVEPIPPK